MKHLLIIFSLLLLSSSPLFAQSERPETIIIPVSSLGDVSDTRKQILQNTLEDELKTHFRLVPQQRFEEVQEQVFDEMDSDECTEDQCIMMIQEKLQVENVFHLQVIGEGSDTQLSLGWRTLDEKKKETDICLKCGTFQLNDKVRGLVEKLVGGKKVVEKPVVVVERSQDGVMYRRRGSDGELEWVRNGNKLTDSKYTGSIEYGLPNGKGIITFPDGEKYRGELRDGKPDGQGVLTWDDGQQYSVEWKEGLPNGIGTVTFSDGIKNKGNWKDGILSGQGVFTYPPEMSKNKSSSICKDCRINDLANNIALLISGVSTESLSISSVPSKSSVYIDGKYVGITPLNTVATFGDHNLEIKNSSPFFLPKKSKIQINYKKRKFVNEKLTQVGVVRLLNIQSGDDIKINENKLSTFEKSLTLSLRSSSYTVSIKRKNHLPEIKKYNLKAGMEIVFDMNTLIPLGVIEFSNLKRQDQVKIDNKPIVVRNGNLDLSLKKGEYQLNLGRKGFKDMTKTLQIENGRRYKVNMDDLVSIKGILNLKINAPSELRFTGGKHKITSFNGSVNNDLDTNLPIGIYLYFARSSYYEPIEGYFEIQEDKATSLNIELKPLPSQLLLTLDSTSQIKESWYSIMGRIQPSGEDDFGIYLNGKLKAHNPKFKNSEFNLEHGIYNLGVKHKSRKYEDHNESVLLLPGRTKNLYVKLNPSEQFLKHSEWQSKMDKLIIASVGSLLVSFESYRNYQRAKENKTRYESLINDESNPDMQDTYYEKTEGEIRTMKSASSNALLFSLVGLGLSGWTYLTWTEQPERSDPIDFSFSSFPNNKLQFALSYNF